MGLEIFDCALSLVLAPRIDSLGRHVDCAMHIMFVIFSKSTRDFYISLFASSPTLQRERDKVGQGYYCFSRLSGVETKIKIKIHIPTKPNHNHM